MSGRKDRLYWKNNESGMYIVRSGYEAAKRMQAVLAKKNQEAESNSSRMANQIWDFVWKLNVKHKLKNFMWSCLHHILPADGTVLERTGTGDSICNCCGEAVETEEHALLLWGHAREIWNYLLYSGMEFQTSHIIFGPGGET